MSTGLFSAVELDAGAADARIGWRLERLEVLNWGTFDRRVWTFEANGHNALLTGDIGSGKSTMVDAVTTLLMPSQKIAYNKAAGAEQRERTLRSYVAGHYKSEQNELTSGSRAVGLRPGNTYSVILGVFVNRAYASSVTLAQVFWMKEGHQGQPDRFYLTAPEELSIAADFTEFGTDVAGLKRRLRERGARLHDHFPDYGRDFRRMLGIESEQAMDLFHQTVSMKSVGDLNDFVRQHMLEPFDARPAIDDLIAHFEDLSAAHEAVLRARAQLAELAPLLQECDEFAGIEDQITAMTAQRDGLARHAARLKVGLLNASIATLNSAIEARRRTLSEVDAQIVSLDSDRQRLEVQRAGFGGDRIREIEQAIAEADLQRLARRARFEQAAELLTRAELPAVTTAEQFDDVRTLLAPALVRVSEELAETENRIQELAVERGGVADESREVNEELLSLQSRGNNLPRQSLDVRSRMCDELQISEDELPFAGELLQVRHEDRAWEGVAERVLRSLGLSLLVPQEHYAAASQWINDRHLGTRLVYYRVPANLGPASGAAADSPANPLHGIVQVKGGAFAPWLERQLVARARHELTETMEEFRRAEWAVTKQGQVKSGGGRHDKDDSRRIDDRRSYVLGWSNEEKVQLLIEEAHHLQRQLTRIDDERGALAVRRRGVEERRTSLDQLQVFGDWSELDWMASVNRMSDLTAEKERIEASSGELVKVTELLNGVQASLLARRAERDHLIGENRGDERERDSQVSVLDRLHGFLAGGGSEVADEILKELERLFSKRLRDEPFVDVEAVDRADASIRSTLTNGIDSKRQDLQRRGQRIVGRMREFRVKFPMDVAEADDSVQSADEYRRLQERLAVDDLPRFEASFKEYLNTNTIRDIAGFSSQLHKHAELIKERVDTINESLVSIDYNPGRYISLIVTRTPSTEIRDFIADLRACTDDSLAGEDQDQYSEQKFLQVKRIIERLKGREGQTEADRAWTKRVSDVRNWYVFSASERSRDDDVEHEHYTDSGGKSGGQKEKLAYTILAASLAYQFKLEWGVTRSKTFRFVVIDEAFGRGSDDSTRFALSLFARLGLQLLIVTPLQKIHVIEPFVSSVGFVDNITGRDSRLQNLSIEELHEKREARRRER
jgi:uncharacterized protein YPO0396